MNDQPVFETAIEAMQWLKDEGYTQDFNLETDCIRAGALRIMPEAFTIHHVFRFEGNTDPGDEEIVYGIASDQAQAKGILFNAYGIYADPLTDEMIRKLR